MKNVIKVDVENEGYASQENYHVAKRRCGLVRATNQREKVLFRFSWH